MTLTKAKIAERLYFRQPNLSQRDTKEITERFFDIIKDEIVESGEVKLSGFGNFTTRDKKSRPGRNPKTKEPAIIAARRVCTFKCGKKLRDRCENPTIDLSEFSGHIEPKAD